MAIGETPTGAAARGLQRAQERLRDYGIAYAREASETAARDALNVVEATSQEAVGDAAVEIFVELAAIGASVRQANTEPPMDTEALVLLIGGLREVLNSLFHDGCPF